MDIVGGKIPKIQLKTLLATTAAHHISDLLTFTFLHLQSYIVKSIQYNSSEYIEYTEENDKKNRKRKTENKYLELVTT